MDSAFKLSSSLGPMGHWGLESTRPLLSGGNCWEQLGFTKDCSGDRAHLTIPQAPRFLVGQTGDISRGSSDFSTGNFMAGSYLFRLLKTLQQFCNCRINPSPGWMQGRPCFVLPLASSQLISSLLIKQAITNVADRDTPAQQCTNTPPFRLPLSITYTTSSNNFALIFCWILSWISQHLWTIPSGNFYAGGDASKPIETIVMISWVLSKLRFNAELQSPRTSADRSPSSFRITLAEEYFSVTGFMIYQSNMEVLHFR